MFRTNELFVDSVDLAFVYLFLVCDYWYVMTCHDAKDNAGLKDIIPVSKTNNNHKNNRIFTFLYIAFYWKNNLKLCFSLAERRE